MILVFLSINLANLLCFVNIYLFFIKNSIKNLICKNSNLILVSAYTSRLRKGMVIYMTTPILPHNHGDIHNVLEAMPSKDTCADMASAFKQLCDGTRLQIFWLLCHSEECVLNISAAVGMSAPAVSHHLRCLKDAGLITGNRHGKEVHYHIASTTQAALLHHFVDSYLHTSCPGEFDSQGISHSQTEHFQHESCSCGCSHSDN